MVLKRLVELDYRGVAETGQDASLNEHFLDPALIDKPRDQHLLQSVVQLSGSTTRCRVVNDPFLILLTLKLHLKNRSVGAIANLTPRCKVRPPQHSLFRVVTASPRLLKHLLFVAVSFLVIETRSAGRLGINSRENGLWEGFMFF